jgi:uncharacterized oligopeptide transporter (OPT) family protein
MILGFDLDFTRVMLVAVLGGLLGILMMIPLRRALIKDQHGYLKYPEGTACAEVLKAGASKESREASDEVNTSDTDDAALQGGKIISIGFAAGFTFNALMKVFSFWKETPTKVFDDSTFKGGSVSLANDPTLLGVGYIIGPRIAGLMMGGGVLSYLVLIPMIKFFGGDLTTPVAPELSKTIASMENGVSSVGKHAPNASISDGNAKPNGKAAAKPNGKAAAKPAAKPAAKKPAKKAAAKTAAKPAAKKSEAKS